LRGMAEVLTLKELRELRHEILQDIIKTKLAKLKELEEKCTRLLAKKKAEAEEKAKEEVEHIRQEFHRTYHDIVALLKTLRHAALRFHPLIKELVERLAKVIPALVFLGALTEKEASEFLKSLEEHHFGKK